MRFSMSARQRRGILVPAAMFAVLAVLAPLIPSDMNGNRQIIQICSWCIAPLLALCYFVFGGDYTELSPGGIRIRRVGIFRKSWTWEQIDHLYVETSHIQGSVISKVVISDTSGRLSRLTAPCSNSTSMASTTFDEDAAQVISYWQRHTGQPVTPPVEIHRRSTVFGRWKRIN
ncbi:hypothetical protein [Kitasatospora sp. NPDC056531]|uniref:hypothetical protein n=1 Tax=Kitasatospora sp. NPDC056531 TaxID=3345856 RepID=UPI00368A390C